MSSVNRAEEWALSTDADVVVVGYGPVGMTVAALLGRAGHRVLVLERYSGLYNLPRAAIFDDETMRTYAKVGITEGLLPHTSAQRTYQWINGAGEVLMEVDYAAVGRSGYAEWYGIYQPDLEDALHAVNQAEPSVTVRFDAQVDAVEQDGDRVTLTVNGTEAVTARYVIACDGGNSFVRETLGIDQDDYGFSEPWMVCDFRFTRPVTLPGALQIGDPRQPISVISIGPAHHRFSFMLDSVDDFAAERAPEKVWQRVSRFLTPDDAELIRAATYTFRSLIAQRWRVGRILLAGDAAHQMPPFLGQGMCSGVRDAQNLALKLDLVLSGRRGDELLDTYWSERDPHVRAVTEKGVELGRRQTVRDPEKAAERDRALLAKRAAAEAPEKIRFPPLGPGMLADTPGAGELSVLGVVEDADGRRGRLDDVIGFGWTLLVDGDLEVDVPDGVRPVRLGSDVTDVNDTYKAWFAELGPDVAAVLIRPDFYVFGTATDATSAKELVHALGPVS